MKKNTSERLTAGDFRQLVRNLLRIEPSSLAAMDTDNGSVAAGLNLLVRQTLQRAIGTFWAKDGTTIRLRSDASAKASGWGSARGYALSSLFVWALIQAPRRARGLSYIPLCAADPDVTDLTPRPNIATLDSARQAGAVATTLLRTDSDGTPTVAGPGSLQAMPIGPLVEELLGIKPEIIVRAWHKTRRDAEDAFGRDPEGQLAAALSSWVMSILDLHEQVLAEQIYTIRLLIIDDGSYEGPANARYANIGTLLLAGCLAEGNHDVAFMVHEAA